MLRNPAKIGNSLSPVEPHESTKQSSPTQKAPEGRPNKRTGPVRRQQSIESHQPGAASRSATAPQARLERPFGPEMLAGLKIEGDGDECCCAIWMVRHLVAAQREPVLADWSGHPGNSRIVRSGSSFGHSDSIRHSGFGIRHWHERRIPSLARRATIFPLSTFRSGPHSTAILYLRLPRLGKSCNDFVSMYTNCPGFYRRPEMA
ncbi:hypothetical protein Enr8_34400 [Blastopirellula retiformator]|uniref:Uncharacterized protein n=1 Tax=Blastopirellula retiformator TaxID=2527970 RepID=A0A5C5UZG7_9BACT|nr:hypothetical protein Enr8_34400 [Blastopirellula retiformator]